MCTECPVPNVIGRVFVVGFGEINIIFLIDLPIVLILSQKQMVYI